MMTAQQAKEFSRIYRKNIVECELKRIKREVEEATKEGSTGVWVKGIREEETEQTLKNLGYELFYDDDKGIFIHWGE